MELEGTVVADGVADSPAASVPPSKRGKPVEKKSVEKSSASQAKKRSSKAAEDMEGFVGSRRGGETLDGRKKRLDGAMADALKSMCPASGKVRPFLERCRVTKRDDKKHILVDAVTWVVIFERASALDTIRKGELDDKKGPKQGPFEFKAKRNVKAERKVSSLLRRLQDHRKFWGKWTVSIVAPVISQQDGFRVSEDIKPFFHNNVFRDDVRIFYVEMLVILRRNPHVQRIGPPLPEGACPFDYYLTQSKQHHQSHVLPALLYFLLGGYYWEEQVKQARVWIRRR